MKGFVYRAVHVIIFLFAKIFFKLKIVGHSNIPREGGVIVAANHVSYLDPPLIGCSILRSANFMAMSELFKNPFCRVIYRAIGAFPVKREEADTKAIKNAIRLLKEGNVVVIFPEGTRSYDGKLQEPKGGVGMIVSLSKAKVVPAFIKGTEKAFPRGAWVFKPVPVTVYFGEPLEFSGEATKKGLSAERKILYNNINMKIMGEIAKMQEKAVNRGDGRE